MFRKIALATIALATLGGTAFAGNYNYGNNYNAGYHNDYVAPAPVYQPQYRKVCEPVFETKYVYDQYTYQYVAKQIKVGEKCFLVEVKY